MEQKISASFLKKKAAAYKSLKGKSAAISRYNEQRRLEFEAEKILQELQEEKLDIRPDNIKAYISYVNAFSTGNRRDDNLAKLQQYADFDVREYADKHDKSFTEKLLAWFETRQDMPKYLTASQMKKRRHKYHKLCHKVNEEPWRHVSENNRVQNLRYEAQKYAADVASGKLEVKPEDGHEFRDYISFICYPIAKDSIERQAISKVSAMLSENRIKAPENSRPVAGVHFRSVWQKAGNKLKIASISLLTVVGTLVGIKSCGSMKKAESPVEQPKITIVKQNTAKNKPQIKKSVKTVSLQKIWNNYYDNTIEILSSASQKQKLYSQIEKQVAAGIYVLPQDISKEKMAYSYLIYKEYGVKSSIAAALNSKEKLSLAAQQRLVEDVKQAGDKGEGVKQMAAKFSKGRLSSYSKYDKASPALQKQHIKNLKELMQAKKMQQAR